MASACIHEEELGKVINFLHPNLVSNIKRYNEGYYYLFPSYHSCSYRNRNGTIKKIQYNRGEQCVNPVHTSCWRPVKKKYLGFPPRAYLTRYRKNYFKNTRNTLIFGRNVRLLLNFKKSYLHYSRLTIQEGLDTETNELQMHLGQFDKDILKKRGHCRQVFTIKKKFKIDEDACNAFVKLLEKDTKINPQIHVLWKDNVKYRVLSDLHRSYIDYIFCRERKTAKSKKVSDENLDIHLNVLFNY